MEGSVVRSGGQGLMAGQRTRLEMGAADVAVDGDGAVTFGV